MRAIGLSEGFSINSPHHPLACAANRHKQAEVLAWADSSGKPAQSPHQPPRSNRQSSGVNAHGHIAAVSSLSLQAVRAAPPILSAIRLADRNPLSPNALVRAVTQSHIG